MAKIHHRSTFGELAALDSRIESALRRLGGGGTIFEIAKDSGVRELTEFYHKVYWSIRRMHAAGTIRRIGTGKGSIFELTNREPLNLVPPAAPPKPLELGEYAWGLLSFNRIAFGQLIARVERFEEHTRYTLCVADEEIECSLVDRDASRLVRLIEGGSK